MKKHAIAVLALAIVAAVGAHAQSRAGLADALRYEGGKQQNITPISGSAGENAPSKAVLTSNAAGVLNGAVGMLQKIEFYEDIDDPVRFVGSGNIPWTSGGKAQSTVVSATLGAESAGTGTSKKTVMVAPGRAINGLQVCEVNGKVKGLRIFGGSFNESGAFVPDHGAVTHEAKRPNCLTQNQWKTKVQCPAGQVAIGLRGDRSPGKGFTGLALICSPYKLSQTGVAVAP